MLVHMLCDAPLQGFHVALLARRLEVSHAVAEEIEKAGGSSSAISCDVTSDASVKAAFDEAKALGVIEVSSHVDCAGMACAGDFISQSPLPVSSLAF